MRGEESDHGRGRTGTDPGWVAETSMLWDLKNKDGIGSSSPPLSLALNSP